MLGSFALKSLGPEDEAGFFKGEDLATRLLGELINRAAMLYPLLDYARDQQSGNEAMYLERLENFGSAVEVFLDDVDEARVRGVNAGFFALDDVHGRVVDGCAVMAAHLEEIGADWTAVKDTPAVAGEKEAAR